MKTVLRNIFWKFLGGNYLKFLNNQRRITFLDDYKDAIVGNNSYNNGAKIWKWNTCSNLTIGNYCSIANDVHFILDSGNHDMFNITTSPLYHNLYKHSDQISYKSKSVLLGELKNEYIPKKHSIKIKNEVWIGAGVTILPGVTIGNGAIILAGAVVTKSVDDFSIVSGIPGQHINYRYSPEQIKKLNTIAWWNWSDEKIKLHLEDFHLNIEDFIQKHS